MAQHRRTPATAMTGALEDVPATNPNSSRYAPVKSEKQEPRVGQLIDKHGHVHSEEIFRNWSPAAIKALGIHGVGDEPNSPSPTPSPSSSFAANAARADSSAWHQRNERLEPNEYLHSLPV